VGVIADRVKALGGNPDAVLPSPGDGGYGELHKRGEERLRFVGKVAELVYDRFGDFEGFALDTKMESDPSAVLNRPSSGCSGKLGKRGSSSG
jgi:hypothetical protein